MFVTTEIGAPTDPVPNDLQVQIQILDSGAVNPIPGGTGTAAPGTSSQLSAYALNANTVFFVRVQAVNATTLLNSDSKPYNIKICYSDTPATPTTQPTLTATATATIAGAFPDDREVNDTPYIAFERPDRKSFINVGSQIANMNFFTNTPSTESIRIRELGDVDWYWFYSPGGRQLRVTTAVQAGVDTELFVFDGTRLPDRNDNPQIINLSTQGQIAFNDDYQPVDRGSQVIFTSSYEGIYWLKVWNKDQSPRGAGQTYNITVVEIAASTGTPTPPATAFPAGADRFEYNGDFNSSTLIAPGLKIDQLNFVPFQPPSLDTPDNDFYRLPVKQGLYYTCETQDLSAGTDTNIIVYRAPDFSAGLGGNDDISEEERLRGNFRSRFSWLATYSGYAYVVVGQTNPPRANEAGSRTYSLLCNIGLPPSPTPTVDPNPPTATPPPVPTTPPIPPTPEPTIGQPVNLVVEPIDLSASQPTAVPSPTPSPIIIEVQTFIDYNRNGQLDPGSNEGIAGTSVRLYDAQTGTPLGQAFTDGDGKVRVAINNDGPVQVSVPVFGYLTTVSDSPSIIRIGIAPTIELPERLP